MIEEGENTLVLTEEEFLEVAKKMPAGEFQAVVLDILKRFIAADDATKARINENLVQEHKKVKEITDMVNEHTRLLEEYRKAWTENFENLARKVNEQSAAILALRDMVLPAVEN